METIERIRNATFTLTRRGYDRREVDSYLCKLADWLEGGARASVEGVRPPAEDYARKRREDADAYATRVRAEADEKASEAVKAAEEKAIRMVEEGAARRRQMEKVIADLQSRREAIVKGLEKLSSQLAGAASQGTTAGRAT